VREVHKDFEVVFVSRDKDESSFTEYFSSMPWLAVPFSDVSLRERLCSKYDVIGIPALVVIDSTGEVIAPNARSAAAKDSQGLNFPWRGARDSAPGFFNLILFVLVAIALLRYVDLPGLLGMGKPGSGE